MVCKTAVLTVPLKFHSLLDVTSRLTTLIINGIASHSSLLDSYVVLYAAFVSSLHKIVGIEFGTVSPRSNHSPHPDAR
jgi:hypothetical protein